MNENSRIQYNQGKDPLMKTTRVSVISLLMIAVLSLSLFGADDLPELKFEKYTLPNGLDVILHEDHSIPVVAVNVWYHVGSKNEKPGRTGFAHLFEHMMFQGSEHHNVMFDEGIDKYGGSNNGSTGDDRTNYWENVPSNYLEKALWLEADRMGYLLPAVTQERLDNQRSVVMNEKRQNYDDQPYGKVGGVIREMMYPSDHPYSWQPIGKMEDLAAASLEDVKGFFREYYTPNNASLCIAGDFDPAQAKAWVEKYFGTIPPGPPVDRFEHWVPVLTEEVRVSLEDKVQLPRLYMAWHTPPYYAPGDAEFDLLAGILASGKSSRLYKSLVYDKQIAQSVSAYQASREIGSSFHVTITAKEGHTLGEIEREVNRIMDDLLVNGFTDEELIRAKTGWEAGFVRQLQKIGGFGGRADILNAYNTYLGDPGNLRWDKDRYANATAEGIMSYARKYLKNDARLVVHVDPQGALSPAEVAVDMNIEPGAAMEPSFNPPDIQKTTLNNGMELYLVEDHDLPLIQTNILIKSGWASDPADRPGTSSLTADLLNEGTKSRSALQISNEILKLGINLSSGSSFDNTTISLNSLKKTYDQSLELMSDIILNPSFPQEELDRLKQMYLGQIKQESIQPFTVAFKGFLKELYGENHPYGQPYTGTGTEESISAIERSDLVDYYRANFLPNNAAAILVGDISLDEAKTKLEKAFKNWKSGEVAEREVEPVQPLNDTRICIIDKPGAAQSTIIVGNLIESRNDPNYLPATVVSEVLGGGSLGRLYMNLRQDKGYTYGSYSAMLSRVGQGAFIAYAQVQSEFTKESLVEFMKELRGITGEKPISPEELTDARNALTMGFPQDFQTVNGIANQLETIITYGLPLNQWDTYINRVASVDNNTAIKVAGDYINPDALLIFIVGDREKIEPKVRALNLGEIILSSLD